MQNTTHEQLTKTLQEVFHFQQFRPGQLEALNTLMTQNRLICIQPTGYGKSLLYQLPATLLNGITLVISPLLALMRDQLIQLKNRFNIPAVSMNTDQSDEENFAAKQAVRTGQTKILFIAPEQLDHIERFNFLLQLPISLLVVDEAHCISTWGHDFRPSYREIIKFVRAIAEKNTDLKLLALTATANEKVAEDIKDQLSVDKQQITVHRESMNRPNIRLSAIRVTGIAQKLITLKNLLSSFKGSGLIYCATREHTEIVAEYLTWQGMPTIAYHAGIDAEQKRVIQNNFITDQHPIIAATNALGMGIDKANLRFIIHFNYPGSITAYYQEVGRCGRDGLPADGILLYDPVDSRIQKHFIESAQPSESDFQIVLDMMKSSPTLLNLNTLKRLTGLHPTRLNVVMAELIEQGFIKKTTQNRLQVYQLIPKTNTPNLDRYTTQLKVKYAELTAIQHYAEQSRDCLMIILRKALGDKENLHNCKQCNICTKTTWQMNQDQALISTTNAWLNKRTVPITLATKIKNAVPGLAVLDSRLRSNDFKQFMHARADAEINLGLSDHLMQLIQICLQDLNKKYSLSCIIPLPSRTWRAKNAVGILLAQYLNIPILDILTWKTEPKARQGELLNNDQRQHNVINHLAVKSAELPKGAILLFDDYTGSNATLNEAARALNEHVLIDTQIVPFTIAAVKWHLGKAGMI